jgi:DNA topoisomerase-3
MKKAKTLGVCPECGGEVVEREGFYGCEGWRDGCRFTLSVDALASLGHPRLSPKQMRKLLKGPVQLRFRMANGTERLFWVCLEEMEGRWRPRIDFEAGAVAESLGVCPRCGADVAEYPLSFGCTRWEQGCDFAIFKNSIKRFGGKMLSHQKARELLGKGRTEVTIRGRDGSPRKVTLLLDPEFGCKIDFEGVS